jgi:hypothetical protein
MGLIQLLIAGEETGKNAQEEGVWMAGRKAGGRGYHLGTLV